MEFVGVHKIAENEVSISICWVLGDFMGSDRYLYVTNPQMMFRFQQFRSFHDNDVYP